MTATNCDGVSLATATKQVVVMAGSLIVVDPLSLESTQCPDSLMTYTLTICNDGDQPLTWSLTEIAGTGVLGTAPIPPLQAAPARSDDASAFPRIESENHILANPVLIIQDQYPWSYSSIQDILTANGIAYDQVGSSQMATIDLSPYELVIIPSDQGSAFYTAWNANLARFEAYVNSGGALWIGTTTAPTGLLPDPLLPGGVALIDDMFDAYDAVVAAGHPWVAGVVGWFYGNWASHSEFSNLYPGSIVVTQATTTGNPTLVDYAYGSGRVLITGLTLEITWAYGWGGAPILQNSLLDMYDWATNVIPWVSEDPTSGTVAAGDCVTVEVTFDSTGMAPGTLHRHAADR